MADGSSGNIRSIYVEWALRDKVSGPAEQIDRRLSLTRNRAEEVKYSFWDTNSAMESLSSAGAFFGNIEQDLRETAIRQQYHNRLLGEAAVKYTRLKTSAREFAETTKAKIREASAAINEHQGAILGIGAALTGAGYLGSRFYSSGTRDLASYEDAYATFVKNVGANSEDLIRQMQEASAGTVSETQIILNANRAMVMDIPYDYLPRMMEVSRAAARAMGEDINYMFDSIVTGSARESPLILDNLGIQMNQLTEYEKEWAKARGLNANALTAEQQRQVFLNYVMENSAAILQKVDLSQESLNEQIARSQVAWDEFRRELMAGARPAIAGILNITEGATSALRDMPAPLKAVIGTAGLAGTVIAGIGGPLLINAVAVTYLITNYNALAGSLATAKTAMLTHASTLLTRLIPASVAAAYAQGGLTAALWAGAAASWAFLAPWLPIIGAVGLAVGAVLLLQDVLVKGWDNSYLGQFVGWLLEKLPLLQPVVDAVVGGFQWFRDAVVGAAFGVGAFLDRFGPLKYLILGPVMPLLLLKDLLTGTGDTAGTFLKGLAAIPGALQAFIADPIGTITGLVETFIVGITTLPQKAASALQGATQLPVIGPAIGMFLDGARAVSGFIDRLGPLKVALLGPIAPLVFLAQHVDTVAGGVRRLWGTLTGAASGVGAFLDRFGPLKSLLLAPVMPLLLLKDLLAGTGDSVGIFLRDLAAIPGALQAFIADPLGTIAGLADSFITGIASLPQKAASALQGATTLPVIGPVIGMFLDGARAVSGFIDRLGPLKTVLLAPIAPLVYLGQHVDTVVGGFRWFRDAVVGAAFGVGAFLDRFGPLKYLILAPVGALTYLAKIFDAVTATVRGFIDWIAAIPRTLGSAVAAITDNPIFKILSGAASFAANTFGTALEIITPRVKPEVIAPDMDPEYYTKGSIAFKVRTPEVRPDILPPDPSTLDRLGSLLAGALTAPITPILPPLTVPRIPDLVTPRVPDITPPEIPPFEAPPAPGQPSQTGGNGPISITIHNTVEVNGVADGNLEKQIRDALSRSTADQVKLVERRLVDQLRAFGI